MNESRVAPRGGVPGSVVLSSAPMDEAMSVGGLVFHRHTLIPLDAADPPRLTLNSFRAGPITLGTIRYSSAARVVTGAVSDWYQINIPVDGSLRTGRQGDRIVADGRLAAVYGLHQHEFEVADPATRILGVKIDRVALERRLEQMLGRTLSGSHIEFALGFPLDRPQARDWYVLLQVLARRLWSGGGLATEPHVLLSLQDAVLSGVLLAAPHAFRDELTDPAGPAAPRAVRKAVAYVDSSPDAALVTVPELAEIAGVGIRSLQAGFRQAMDVSPLTFLRERRLTRARRDLEELTPEVANVAEVADRWGFAHHGRFSSDYRRRFGESPSETLRR